MPLVWQNLESTALKLCSDNDETYVSGTNSLRCSKIFGSVDNDCWVKLVLQVVSTTAGFKSGKDKLVDALKPTPPLLAAIAPRNELEGMLAVQMVGIHNLAMEMMARAVRSDQTVEGVSNNVNRVTKLTRTFIAQMDALNKHRGKGQQKMTWSMFMLMKAVKPLSVALRGGMKIKSKKQPHGQRLGKLKNGNIPCDLAALPCCNASAKSTGQQCRQPAMKNGKCYWHGGRSPGAAKGNQNAFKHGLYTKDAKTLQLQVRMLLRGSRDFLEELFR